MFHSKGVLHAFSPASESCEKLHLILYHRTNTGKFHNAFRALGELMAAFRPKPTGCLSLAGLQNFSDCLGSQRDPARKLQKAESH